MRDTCSRVVRLPPLDFFKENIADIENNDSTTSYGSIVGATPKGYRVSKKYFPAVGQNFRQRYIIVHYTALDDDESIQVLTEQQVSSHYLVNDCDDDSIWQLVDENKRAYHAGVSSWGDDTDLNTSSIGIEIVNLGFKKGSDGQLHFIDYPDYQIEKVAALMKDIAERYNITPNHILGHSDVAPMRKLDPGPKFPWRFLYEKYGLGMWYERDVKNSISARYRCTDFTKPAIIEKIQNNLKRLGYGIAVSGKYDDTTKSVVRAFQYHFRPEETDGVVDAETFAILDALVRRYKS